MIETMKTSERLPRRVDRLRRRIRPGRVADDCPSRSAKRLLRSLHIVFVPPDHHDLRARFDKRLRRGETDARRAAHDDEDFVSEPVHAASIAESAKGMQLSWDGSARLWNRANVGEHKAESKRSMNLTWERRRERGGSS